ncbi:MAG TPA: efflux RND transporter periplasmic adaptor subunit [bacterium]|nr:efflux RND transporter periplasmic adaptor subunit [bacterium]
MWRFDMIQRILIMLLIAALLPLIVACGSGNAGEQPAVAVQPRKEVTKEVRLVEPLRKKGAVTIRESVTLAPEEKGAVASEVGGTVLKFHVEENQRVKKGQIVATLDATDYILGLEQARAGVAALEAQYAGLGNDYQRLKGLYEKGAASKQQLDGIETQYNALEKQIEANRKAVSMMEKNVAKTQVRAPFDGVITKKKLAVGAKTVTMMPDSADVAFIEKLDRLKVNMQVSELYFGEIGPGDPVSFSIPALGRTVEAKIHSKGSTLNDMKKFSIIVYIENGDMSIPSGISAIATIKTKEKERIIVPPTAVRTTGERNAELYTIDNGVVAARSVITGFPFEEGLEVSGDIPAQVVSDASLVKPGEAVSAKQ